MKECPRSKLGNAIRQTEPKSFKIDTDTPDIIPNDARLPNP